MKQRHTYNLRLTPITLKLAFKFCDEFHSYQKAPQGALFAVAAVMSDEIECVAIIGRPRSTILSDGRTCEVLRLISTGRTFNAASFTLQKAARAAFALGYTRIVSYTDKKLTAAAYRAAGWNIAREHKVKPWHGRKMLDEVGRLVLRWELHAKTHAESGTELASDHHRRRVDHQDDNRPCEQQPLSLNSHDELTN